MRFKKLICTFLILFTSLIVSCVAHTPSIKSENGVASLEKVTLGGVKQSILIRGKDKSNPILLFVHGGPGSPEMPMANHFQKELEDHFVVVNWDQRGAGKSYCHTPKETLKVDQFVSDATELTELLMKRFGAKKIYLVGHSWGTVIGVLTVKRHPENYYAYVGIGQVVDIVRNEQLSYKFVLEQAEAKKNKKAIRQLKKIQPPYNNLWELKRERNWLTKFGGWWYIDPNQSKLMRTAIKTGKEYNAADWVKYGLGAYRSIKVMWWKELNGINFIKDAPRLEVPVYFFEGRHDYNTPFMLVQEYYEKLEAPKGKQLIWFDNSAHSPNLEEPHRFAEMMVSKVLAETFRP